MPCSSGYDWCKDEPVVPQDGDKEFCVFHAPLDNKSISIADFNAKVYKRIHTALQAQEKCDLSGTIFPGDIYFINENFPEVIFCRVQFCGKADFTRAHFNKRVSFQFAKFDGHANFSASQFDHIIDSTHVQFCGHANFRDAVFYDEANFVNAHFTEETNFNDAVFSKGAFFVDVQFESGADFCDALFCGGAYFSRAIFFKKVGFFKARFMGDSYFTEVTFDGSAEFNNAQFQTIVTFDLAVINNRMDWTKTVFGNNSSLSLMDANIKGEWMFNDITFPPDTKFHFLRIEKRPRFEKCDLTHVSFLNSPIKEMDFIACKWPEINGRKVIADEVAVLKQLEEKGYTDETRIAIEKTELLYQGLKKKYKDEDDAEKVANWHIGEKTMFLHRTRYKNKFLA